MTKRPTLEEFMEKYDQYTSRRQAVLALHREYQVSESTVYEWIKQYVNAIETSVDDIENQTEDFYEMVDNILNDDLERKYRSADISIPVDSGGILIICMSDLHAGSRYTDYAMLKEHTKMLEEIDGLYAFILGDLIDVAGVKSTPHKDLLHDQILTYKKDKNFIREMFKKIGPKVLALTTGCHGSWSYGDTGEYFEEELVKMTDTKVFLEHGGLLTITLGDQTYKIFVTHKIRGNSKLNPTRGIMRLHEQGMDFDVGVAAHHHVPCIQQLPRREKIISAIKCGSYKCLDTFGNKAGYVQQKMTIPGIYLSADSDMVIPFMDWRQGLGLLR